MLQEVGQQAGAAEGLDHGEHLGGKGMALFLAQPQARLGFFAKDLDGPPAQIFLHRLWGSEAGIRGKKPGPRGGGLDCAAGFGVQVRFLMAPGQDDGPTQAIAATDRHPGLRPKKRIKRR